MLGHGSSSLKLEVELEGTGINAHTSGLETIGPALLWGRIWACTVVVDCDATSLPFAHSCAVEGED